MHSFCACYSSRLSLSTYSSNFPLKPFTVVASITSLGRSFHVSTTLWLKNFLLWTVFLLCLKIFRWCPLVFSLPAASSQVPHYKKNYEGAI